MSEVAKRKKRQKMLLTDAESKKRRVKEVVQLSRGSKKGTVTAEVDKMLMYGREREIRNVRRK